MTLSQCFPCFRSPDPRHCYQQRQCTIITTSLTANRLGSYYSRRLKYLLDAKLIEYEEIDLATLEGTLRNKHLIPIFVKYPESRDNLPAIYINEEYIGDFDMIQELEDREKLTTQLYKRLDISADGDHSQCDYCAFMSDSDDSDISDDNDVEAPLLG